MKNKGNYQNSVSVVLVLMCGFFGTIHNIENCWFKIKIFIKFTRITANGQFDNFQNFYNEPSLCVLSLLPI